MPNVNPNEKEGDYVSRCMADPSMHKEFPDQKQRAAVCYSKFKQAKKAKTAQGSSEDPKWSEEESKGYITF